MRGFRGELCNYVLCRHGLSCVLFSSLSLSLPRFVRYVSHLFCASERFRYPIYASVRRDRA